MLQKKAWTKALELCSSCKHLEVVASADDSTNDLVWGSDANSSPQRLVQYNFLIGLCFNTAELNNKLISKTKDSLTANWRGSSNWNTVTSNEYLKNILDIFT